MRGGGRGETFIINFITEIWFSFLLLSTNRTRSNIVSDYLDQQIINPIYCMHASIELCKIKIYISPIN
jgi:hypothetical protein